MRYLVHGREEASRQLFDGRIRDGQGEFGVPVELGERVPGDRPESAAGNFELAYFPAGDAHELIIEGALLDRDFEYFQGLEVR